LSSQFHPLDLHGLPKLDFELEDSDHEKSIQQSLQRSPLQPEDRIIGRRIGKQSVDFISDLIAVNCTKICQQICSYLEPQDLCRFASVSSEWRSFAKQDFKVRERWRGFLEECKKHFDLKGKENRGLPLSLKSTYFDDLARLPLQSISLNKPHQRSYDDLDKATATTDLPFSHPQISRPLSELRPCPKCTSPSNSSNIQEGHCQCQKCGLRFCSVCLRDSEQHTSDNRCDGLSIAPSTRTDQRLRSRKPGKDIVGSKRSKDRVRRL